MAVLAILIIFIHVVHDSDPGNSKSVPTAGRVKNWDDVKVLTRPAAGCLNV